MKPYLFKLFIFLVLSSFLIPLAVSGQIKIENPLKYEKLEDIIGALINFLFWIAVAVLPIVIIIAGFYFVTSGGDPARVQTAQRMILYAVIGFVIILLAKGLVAFLGQILGAKEEETYFRNLIFAFLWFQGKFKRFL